MAYKLEWRKSPNYTPHNQTKAFYGRPREILFGAGHWWGLPTAGYSHDGVVNTFLNPARQGSAHAVLSKLRVTEMVRDKDTAWTTNNANPYTFSIEVDPRIMYRWQSGGDKALANAIFETLAEYIADKGYHNLTWRPHKYWYATQCNPIPWGEVMKRAKQIHAAKNAPKPTVKVTSRQTFAPKSMIITKNTYLMKMPSANKVAGTSYNKGQQIDNIVELTTWSNGKRFYRTQYSKSNNNQTGFGASTLKDIEPPKPEWQRNLKDIKDVKLMVLTPTTALFDLNTGKPIKELAQGTWIDIAKSTKVDGTEYLISAYSAKNAMPNGLKKSDLGQPEPEPPVEDKPEWHKNWRDIEDKTMYARLNAEVINLLDGETVDVIPKGTPVKVASATVWHGQDYFITEWSTENDKPHGIAVVDLDDEPPKDDNETIPPSVPTDDLIKENNVLLRAIQELLQWIVDKISGVFK